MSNRVVENGSYRKQINTVLSNREIKNVYKFICDSEEAITKEKIKNNCNIYDIDNILDILTDMYLIREKCKYASTGINKVYEKDVILGGYEDTIKKHIND